MRLFLLLIGHFLLTLISVKAQVVCTPLSVQLPDTLCLNQTFTAFNQSPVSHTYEWDFAAGDLLTVPAGFNVPVTGVPGGSYSFNLARDGNNYFGFAASVQTNTVVRFDFGPNLEGTPTLNNLGNFGLPLNGSASIVVYKENNTWIGFVSSRATNALFRLNFGNSLTNTPTTSQVTFPGTYNPQQIQDIKIIKDGNNYIMLAASFGSNLFKVINFGSSLLNNPQSEGTLAVSFPGLSNIQAFDFFKECGNWIVICSDLIGNRVARANFGPSWNNPNPTFTNLTPGLPSIFQPSSVKITQENGRFLVHIMLFQSGGILRMNFGNSLLNTPAGQIITPTGTAPVQNATNFELVKLNNSRVIALFTTTAGRLVRLTYGDGAVANESVVTQYSTNYAYTVAGKYYVTLTATDATGNTSQIFDSIFVKNQSSNVPAPILDFITDDACPSRPTRFFPQIQPQGYTVGSYLWTFPGGFTSTLANPTRQFPAPGNYDVTMRIRSVDGCFSGSVQKRVRIFPNPASVPTSNFTAPAQVCTFDSVQFTDASTWSGGTISRWFWDFGNGVYSTRQNPKALFSVAQTYTVSLKASDSSGCGNAFTRQITVQAGPNVAFSNQRECLGQAMQFTNQTTFPPGTSLQSVLWNFGNPGGTGNTSTSTAPTVTYTYPDTGVYNVSLRVTSNIGCISTFSRQVRVYALPRVRFSIPQITFVNQPAQFVNLSVAPLQTIDSLRWNFGNPGAGASNISTLPNPTHTYTNTGLYNVNLRVVTNKGCINDTTRQVVVRAPCPVLAFNQVFASANNDTAAFRNQSSGIERFTVDFCAGDLEEQPTMIAQNTAVGSTPGIGNAAQVIPVRDGNNWIGFIPTPQVGFIKAQYGNNLQNDAVLDPSLGNPGGVLGSPVAIRFVQVGDTIEAIAVNSNNRLYRMRFPNGINQLPDSLREINLPTGTIATPTHLHVVQERDTIFVFLLNNNNQTSNNFIVLRFLRTLRSTPVVINRPNPPVMQNATGYFNFQTIRECNIWYGLLLANNQLYKLRFGLSLGNVPEVTLLTPFLSQANIPVGLLTNFRGLNMFAELGKVYAFINSTNGNFIRVEFGNGLAFDPTKVQNMGSFNVTGTVGAFNMVKHLSEYYGFGINQLGVIYKLRFPNFCPVDNPVVENLPVNGVAGVRYYKSGSYTIAYSGIDASGFVNNGFINWTVSLPTPAVCSPVAISRPEQLCFQVPFNISSAENLNNAEWDFCTGDLAATPTFSAASSAITGFINTQAFSYGYDGSNHYGFFVATSNVLTRYNLNNFNPNLPIGTNITLPANTLSQPTDIKLIKEGSNWLALVVNQLNDNLNIINFGPTLDNNSPTVRTLSLDNYGDKLRGIEVVKEGNDYYALVTSLDVNKIAVLHFGNSLRNLPSVRTFTISRALNLNKISLVRQCGTYTAFITDQSVDSLWRVDFANGLFSPPTRVRGIEIPKALTVKAIQEGGNYYVFVTTDANNAFYRISYGRSLQNTPSIQNFGNFSTGTNTPSLNRVIAFDLFRTINSEHHFFGIGTVNAIVYQLRFPNVCSAADAVVSGVNSFTQVYNAPGTYYITLSGEDRFGNYLVTRDSLLVRNPAAASFSFTGNRCPGEPITFIDNSQINVPGIIYRWDFGVPGDTSNQQSPVYTYSAPGQYTVRLALREPSGCENRAERVVTIFPRPIANFGFAAGNICTNDSIQFTDSTLSGGDVISAYAWRVTNSIGQVVAQSTAKNPRFAFPAVGTYTVAMQVTGGSGCSANVSKTVQVNRVGPAVNFNFKQPCFGDTITFAANISQSYDSLAWRLNGNVVSRQPVFTFSFPNIANYTLSLTAYTPGCANTNTRSFAVEQKPSVNIGLEQALTCRGAPLEFTRQNLISDRPIDSTHWSFGDGTFSNRVNPIKVYSDTGTYTVRLTVVTDRGCEGTAIRQVVINPAPTARFVTSKACLGTPVQFTNQSDAGGIPGGITSYLWQFGDPANNSSTQVNPTFSYSAPGQYIVTLTVRTAAICPAIYRDTINIAPLLSANFEVVEGCQGTPFIFRDISVPPGIADTAVAWDWNIGGRRSNVKNPTLIFDFTGIYGVTLTVTTRNGCTATISNSQAFQVGPPPRPDFTILDSVFASEPLFVRVRRNSNDALSYRWDFGDSSTIYTVNDPPAHLYERQGAYIITMTAIKTPLCSVSISKPVNVVIDQRKGIKITAVGYTNNGGNAQIFADIENESNVAITRINFKAELGTKLNMAEVWNGVLMPGGAFRYLFRPSLAGTSSELIPYVCVDARIAGSVVELTPENNRRCSPVDTMCKLVDAYPVPADRDLNVYYSVPEAANFELRLVDMLGKEAYLLEQGVKQPGVYERKYLLPNLKQGIYYLHCNCNGKPTVRKVAIVKP